MGRTRPQNSPPYLITHTTHARTTRISHVGIFIIFWPSKDSVSCHSTTAPLDHRTFMPILCHTFMSHFYVALNAPWWFHAWLFMMTAMRTGKGQRRSKSGNSREKKKLSRFHYDYTVCEFRIRWIALQTFLGFMMINLTPSQARKAQLRRNEAKQSTRKLTSDSLVVLVCLQTCCNKLHRY